MSTTTIPVEVNGTLDSYDLTATFNNIKTQRNPKTGDIEEYGVSGDVAGIIVNKLNATTFSEINGRINSTIQNILAINEYTYDEFVDLQEKGINIIGRSGSDYYIQGNEFNHPDSEALAKLNIFLIYLYSVGQLEIFMERIISEETGVETKIRAKLDEIESALANFIQEFTYELTLDGRTITIELFEKLNRPISRMTFLIEFIQ